MTTPTHPHKQPTTPTHLFKAQAKHAPITSDLLEIQKIKINKNNNNNNKKIKLKLKKI